MTKKVKISLLSLLISQSCSPVFAETLLPINVERITVTATRQQSLDTDLAMSLKGISKEELAIDNGQHVAESLNSISGVLVDQLSGGQGHKTAIRMPMNTSGYYLYLQDNIPLQSPAFFNHNALWWSSFNSNIARMEVLKGAGTALYGSGAVAATVNILSEEVAQSPETDIGLMLGENEYSKMQLSHSNILSSTQGFRVSASYLNNKGWRDHTGSKRAEVTLRHELELGDDERLVTSLVMSDLEQEMAANLTESIYNTNRTNSGLSNEVLASDPLRKTQYIRLSSQWDKVADDNYFSLIPYYRYRTNDYTATWNQNMPKVESKVQTLGLLALANFEHSNGNGSDSDTSVGLDIELTKGEQLSNQPLDFTTTGDKADTFTKGEKFYDDTTEYISISPYIQYKRNIVTDLDLTLGARHDYAQYNFSNHLDVYGDIGHGKRSLEDRTDRFDHFSPKASLNYHLTQDSSLYLRYANSFRLPTASSLYHLTIKDNGDSKAVDPEISDTYELGYKANWQAISFDTAIYYMDVDDGIVHAYNDEGQRYLTNATRVIHKGLEISVAWEMNEQLNISAAYSKSKHEFDQHDDYSGNEMAAAPDYIANLRLRYMPTFLEGFTGMLELQSIGEYWLDDANSQDDSGIDRTEDGYTIANIKALYQASEQLSFNARILNVTNEEYAQEASYRYGKTQYSPGAPITAYVGVNYQW
ncbi:MAG: iron complex outermembrane receptor protein [Shewanella sp.]|jgi:iron complex outermembrane receptor protein